MIKEDCFGYVKDRKQCRALDRLYCKYGECGFYKTNENYCDKCKESWGRYIDCKECNKMFYRGKKKD